MPCDLVLVRSPPFAFLAKNNLPDASVEWSGRAYFVRIVNSQWADTLNANTAMIVWRVRISGSKWISDVLHALSLDVASRMRQQVALPNVDSGPQCGSRATWPCSRRSADGLRPTASGRNGRFPAT
jgi:hypothetical protein